jgi:CDP-glucose 4,6-dehydratase
MKRKKLYGEAFNLSNEKPCSVLRIVKLIYDVAGKKPNYRILDIAQNEIVDQYLSAAKARRILGWQPRWSLREGLEDTVKWYVEEKSK